MNSFPAVSITDVRPQIDGGDYFVKRAVGESLELSADIFSEAQHVVKAVILWRKENEKNWRESPMKAGGNDRWMGSFVACVDEKDIGYYEYSFCAWFSPYLAWLDFFNRKIDADIDEAITEIDGGVEFWRQILASCEEEKAAKDAKRARAILKRFSYTKQAAIINGIKKRKKAIKILATENDRANILDEIQRELREKENLRLAEEYLPRSFITRYPRIFRLRIDRKRAAFSSWYEMFPRNAIADGKSHATFKDCLPRLKYIADLGFDVVYFPPIHPIGATKRKGKNNSETSTKKDVGSPWAIGHADEKLSVAELSGGGHFSVLPELGDIEDFRKLVKQAKKLGLEIALDFAINCSPDHPYVKESPEWFHKRPDGTIRYAENPPKKYQDIYPLNFHCEDWQNLWDEMIKIVRFWIRQGVEIFRVDNPHTKPVAFWEYLISHIHEDFPRVIFLSEAFTRPKVMRELARIGFTQSYTYFTWRVDKQALIEYSNELHNSELREYFRPNFWPNTPDILAHELQDASENKFCVRAILAAGLSPNWGMYEGYELGENEALPGKEEYLNSEKYQLRKRDFSKLGKIARHIKIINNLRKKYYALQFMGNLHFAGTGNDALFAFLRQHASGSLLFVVNLNPDYTEESNISFDGKIMSLLKLGYYEKYHVRDLISNIEYDWSGAHNYVKITPKHSPAHIFLINH